MTTDEIDEIRVVIERDLKWRLDEISFLASLVLDISGTDIAEIENKRKIVRKTILLTLYSHFEGYFRFAFETYAYALNEERIELNKVIDVLFVSSLNIEFESYDETNKWIMPNENETNKRIKRIFNRMGLLEKVFTKGDGNLELTITSSHISKSSVLHTESNLNPDVIDKVLYGLGIHRNLGISQIEFMKMMGLVSEFVKKRNGIAHGDTKSEFRDGISERDLSTYQVTFNKIVSLIAPIITQSLTEKLYLKEQHR